jgi:hypothetical protein
MLRFSKVSLITRFDKERIYASALKYTKTHRIEFKVLSINNTFTLAHPNSINLLIHKLSVRPTTNNYTSSMGMSRLRMHSPNPNRGFMHSKVTPTRIMRSQIHPLLIMHSTRKCRPIIHSPYPHRVSKRSNISSSLHRWQRCLTAHLTILNATMIITDGPSSKPLNVAACRAPRRFNFNKF